MEKKLYTVKTALIDNDGNDHMNNRSFNVISNDVISAMKKVKLSKSKFGKEYVSEVILVDIVDKV